MKYLFPFPKSFPNQEETTFLHVVLSSEENFLKLFNDWKTVFEFEEVDYATMRLLPLLCHRIQKIGLNDKISGRIRGVYRMAWVKNQLLLRQVENITTVFEAHGIDVVLMKGISLILAAYQDIGARFLDDADLLIDPKHVKKAFMLMAENGCAIRNTQLPDIDYFSSESLQRISGEAHFICRHSVEIDMHWRVFTFLPGDALDKVMPFKDIFQRSILYKFNNKEYRIMSPEDLLLHVIVHGSAGNAHRTLRWVTDSVALIRTQKINWKLFLENMQSYGFNAEVYVAFLYLTQENFIDLPEAVLEQIFSIVPNKKDMQYYQQKANTLVTAFRFFGGIPRLWKIYWQYESSGLFPVNLWRFVNYISRAWGIKKKRHLILLFLQKAKDRIVYFIKFF